MTFFLSSFSCQSTKKNGVLSERRRPAFKSLQRKGLHQTKKKTKKKSNKKHFRQTSEAYRTYHNIDGKRSNNTSWEGGNVGEMTRPCLTKRKWSATILWHVPHLKRQNICLAFVCFICVRKTAVTYLWNHFVLLEFFPRADELFRSLLKPSARSNVCQFRRIQLDF